MDDRLGYIQWVVGDDTGYIGLGAKSATNDHWTEGTFRWPQDADEITRFIKINSATNNVYMCPTLLRNKSRVKENVSFSHVVWADLDYCSVEALRIPPTLVMETSKDRRQALWKLSHRAHALDVEDINRRIAYTHEDEGCDISGWDLTQMLRIPNTRNFKYLPMEHMVTIESFNKEAVYDLELFYDKYPQIHRFKELVTSAIPLPDISDLGTGKELLEKWETSVHPRVWRLFRNVPDMDWSTELWNLQLTLFEIGVQREEVFVIARDAACNKFARDGLEETVLWKEVLRAEAFYRKGVPIEFVTDTKAQQHIPDRDLLTDEERKSAEQDTTIVDEYIEWASRVTDAPPQYHVAGAFIILTSLFSGYLRLPTSYSTMIPNLWFMILADTTLTRKSTAMDLATDIIDEINPEAMLATDGTLEGILQSMSLRPNMPSLFKRDEFSGLLDAMAKKDYYAGMLEGFTKLYDGKQYKRQLKRETIDVRDPIFIMFAGGIKERIYSQLTHHHINSGFIPRFCFVTANADFNKIKPLGPPTLASQEGRAKLVKKIIECVGNLIPQRDPLSIIGSSYNELSMTPSAWRKFNELDEVMQNIGYYSTQDDLLTPMMARLSMSGLKAAMLIAASRVVLPGVPVVIDEKDIIKAFYFVEQWKAHAFQIVQNSGRSVIEKVIEDCYKDIFNAGNDGVPRSSLMNRHKLNARDADNIFNTLEQRGLVTVARRGTVKVYFSVEARGLVRG